MATAGGKEIEIKLRIASADEARRRLEAAGFAIVRPRVFEANLLLDNDGGTLRAAGEALRVRERGGETILTYKGPPDGEARHKTREELETAAGDAVTLMGILARLGFHPTYRYEKYRTEFARPDEAGIATVDETPIGVFMELEGEPDWIDRVSGELGYSGKDFVNDSYATLFRSYCESTGGPVGIGMIFAAK